MWSNKMTYSFASALCRLAISSPNKNICAVFSLLNTKHFEHRLISQYFPNNALLSSIKNNSNDSVSNLEERRALEKWLEMCKFEGECVPEKISEENFIKLLEAKSPFQRKKYMKFLFKKEQGSKKDKIRKERKKEKKAQEREERAKQNLGHITYGLWKNSMFAKTTESTLLDFHHHRLSSTLVHGQPIIFDLGFEEHMKGREISSLAEQLKISISLNRMHSEPFNLTFCNSDLKSKTFHELLKRMPNITTPTFPMNISSKSYMDLYPKEKLVYLTPNCRNIMDKFDHDAVYIIGGIVDLGDKNPLTLAKGKKEKLNMQKLPLDKYHLFRHNKSLGIHIVLAILLDLQKTGDWKLAMENIPKRLLYTSTDRHNIWDKMKKVVR